MEMPTILPDHLKRYRESTNEAELKKNLMKRSEDLEEFFEYALDDETWVGYHPDFIRSLLLFYTNKHFQDDLGFRFSERITKKIQKHYRVLEPLIPTNIQLLIEGKSIPINSMIYGVVSPYFHQNIIRECRDQNKQFLEVADVSYESFIYIHEYVTTGDSKNLWRQEFEELLVTLELSSRWAIDTLSYNTQKILEIYINKDNVIDILLQSHTEHWMHLRGKAMEFINQLQNEVKFLFGDPSEFHLLFQLFNLRSIELFNKLKHMITHLHFRGGLIKEREFNEVVLACEKLRALDISYTDAYNETLSDLPPHLKEIDLSHCYWLNETYLKKFFQTCHKLEKVSLGSNTQLKAGDWILLKDLTKLNELDLSYCNQIDDQQFKIILRCTPHVRKLSLAGCSSITNQLFFDLYSYAPQLQELDVTHTNIDEVSVAELMLKYRSSPFSLKKS